MYMVEKYSSNDFILPFQRFWIINLRWGGDTGAPGSLAIGNLSAIIRTISCDLACSFSWRWLMVQDRLLLFSRRHSTTEVEEANRRREVAQEQKAINKTAEGMENEQDQWEGRGETGDE